MAACAWSAGVRVDHGDRRMSNIPLYQEMRQNAGPLWQAIFAHPFLFFDMSWKKEGWPEGRKE